MWRSGLVFGAGNGRLVGLNGAETPAVMFMSEPYVLPLSTLFHSLPLLYPKKNAAGLIVSYV